MFTMVACAQEDDGKDVSGDGGEKYKIGLVANQTDQFTAWQANEIVNACERNIAIFLKLK